ncbi:helix-turn-helix domain-containing protein [Enterococcus termitis]
MLTLLDSNEKRIINELWLMDLNNGSMPLNLLKEQIGCSLNTLKNDLTQLDSQWYDILDVRIDENQIVHINHLSNGTIDQLLTSLLYNNVNLKILLLLFKETKRDATYYVEQVYCSLPTFYRSIKKLEKFFKGLPIKLVKRIMYFILKQKLASMNCAIFLLFIYWILSQTLIGIHPQLLSITATNPRGTYSE